MPLLEYAPNHWINTDLITNIEVRKSPLEYNAYACDKPIIYIYFFTAGKTILHEIRYGWNTDFDIIIARVNKFLEPFGIKIKEMP